MRKYNSQVKFHNFSFENINSVFPLHGKDL